MRLRGLVFNEFQRHNLNQDKQLQPLNIEIPLRCDRCSADVKTSFSIVVGAKSEKTTTFKQAFSEQLKCCCIKTQDSNDI